MRTAPAARRRAPTLPLLLAATITCVLAWSASAGLNPSFLPISNPDPTFSGFGLSACGIGDINADGYADFAVTTAGHGTLGYALWVYMGGPNGFPVIQGTFTWASPLRVSAAGDVNGDGYDDVLLAYGAGSYPYPGTVQVLCGPNFVTRFTLSGAPFSFGASACAAGDVNRDGFDDIVVGSPNEGAAYVFRGSSTGLHANDLLTLSGNGKFGTSVAGIGDLNGDGFDDVAVGCPDGAVDFSGQVDFFFGLHLGNTTISQVNVSPFSARAEFGATIGPAGDVNGDGLADIMVADPDQGGIAMPLLGPATDFYSFPWEFHGVSPARMGTDVFTAGDINGDGYADVVMLDQNGNFKVAEGRGWSTSCFGGCTPPTFNGSLANPTHGPITSRPAGDVNGDGFGDLLVAAQDGNGGSGEVRLYYGQADGIAVDAIATLYGGQSDALAGWSTAMGDVNGDGYDDLAVGLVHWDKSGGGIDNGAIALYLGGPGGLPGSPSWFAEGIEPGGNLGISVSLGGDVNGDGLGDIVAGAHNSVGGIGVVEVWYGRASWSGSGTLPDWSGYGTQAGAFHGGSVAFAGDVNGDGFADFVAGAPYYDPGAIPHAGRARLYLGSAGGPNLSSWLPTATQAEAYEGAVVAGAGDVNRDGYGDLLVAGPYFDDTGKVDAGHVRLYLGGPGGPSNTATREWRGEAANDRFGYGMAGIGDWDGDGAGDVAVGAIGHNGGKAYLYRGNVSGADATATATFDAPSPGYFGSGVASAGDVNGDGLDDLLVGAVYNNSDTGAGFVYLGGSASNAPPFATLPGGTFGENAGHAVGGGGDVNGDGFGDVAVAAPRGASGFYDEGVVRVYAGGASRSYFQPVPGLPHPARQVRPDDPTRSIAILGRGPRPTSFGLDLLASSPAGRSRVAMEWQVAGLSGPPLTGRTPWTLTGSPFDPYGSTELLGSSVGLLAIAPGLSSNSVYSRKCRILSRSPWFRYGRWLSPQSNGPAQWDVRTSPINTAVAEVAAPIQGVELSAAWPNPSHGVMQFTMGLPRAARVKLTVRDVQGRVVRALEDREREAGRQLVRWDGADDGGRACAAGIYFLDLIAGAEHASRRIAIVR